MAAGIAAQDKIQGCRNDPAEAEAADGHKELGCRHGVQLKGSQPKAGESEYKQTVQDDEGQQEKGRRRTGSFALQGLVIHLFDGHEQERKE